MEQIRRIERPIEIPESGILCDLLWNELDEESDGWGQPEVSCTPLSFGADIVSNFCQSFDFDFVCRASCIIGGGYEFFFLAVGSLVCSRRQIIWMRMRVRS